MSDTAQIFIPALLASKVRSIREFQVSRKDISETETFTLEGDKDCIIGRNIEGVDIPLNGPGVSNQHAKVFSRRGKVYIQDLESTNGVLLNGERVLEAVLYPGDLIYINQYMILYVERFEINE